MKQWIVLVVTGSLGGMLAVQATEPAGTPDEGLLEYLGSVGGEPGLAEYLEHNDVVAKARQPVGATPVKIAPPAGGGGQNNKSGAEKNS